MPRAKQDKLYRSFNKGLITEAGFLTYPEDASIDELNTIIYRKGNRSRRTGIDFEPSSTAIVFPGGLAQPAATTTEYFWKTPNNISTLNFLAVQVGYNIHFFDATVSPMSSGLKEFTVNLLAFATLTATATDIMTNRVHMVSGKGYLFIAQEFIDPIVVTYDDETDTITSTKIIIQGRDFDGIDDGLANDAEPGTLSLEHLYNLLNQGWATPGTPDIATGTGGSPGTSGVYYSPWKGLTLNPADEGA
jgi:hypothetical protein